MPEPKIRELTAGDDATLPNEPDSRTLVAEESRRLAESVVKSLRSIGLECELVDLDKNQTH